MLAVGAESEDRALDRQLPYLPLPTKLHTRVLAPVQVQAHEDADVYAERVHTAVQEALTQMTIHRKPLIG